MVELSVPETISLLASSVAAIAALYSIIQSYLNKRRLTQLEKEKFTSKVLVDFSYSLLPSMPVGRKLLKGTLTFKNQGATNIKIIRLSLDGKDRTDEFVNAYHPTSSNETFSPLEGKLENVRIVGFNNSKQLGLEKPKDKFFRLFKEEASYLRARDDKAGKIRSVDIRSNIDTYIRESMDRIREHSQSSTDQNNKTFSALIFQELLVKAMRGLQIFSGGSFQQEFMISYEGSGIMILNSEASSLRMLQRSIAANEEFKEIAGQLVDEKKPLDTGTEAHLTNLLHESLQPSSDEIIDQRQTFMVYLP